MVTFIRMLFPNFVHFVKRIFRAIIYPKTTQVRQEIRAREVANYFVYNPLGRILTDLRCSL